jgi:hypothetical protein
MQSDAKPGERAMQENFFPVQNKLFRSMGLTPYSDRKFESDAFCQGNGRYRENTDFQELCTFVGVYESADLFNSPCHE